MALAARPFNANHAPFVDVSTDDPLARALQPPPDESPDQRALREQMQREASRISMEIDEDIQESRKAFERRKRAIKILLLGQAESGKSTTLKNFQLAFSPQHFRSEKLAWRTIIQLNLIRSIKQLLEILQLEWQEQDATKPAATTTNGATKPSSRPSSPPSTLSPSSQLGAASGSSSVPQIQKMQQMQMQPPMSAKARGKMRADLAAKMDAAMTAAHSATTNGRPSSAGTGAAQTAQTAAPRATAVRFSTGTHTPTTLNDAHRRIRVRLLPLLAIENELTHKLFPSVRGGAGPESADELGSTVVGANGELVYRPPIKEVCVRAGSGWKGLLSQFTGESNAAAQKSKRVGSGDLVDNPTTVLAACKDDIIALWEDPVVRGILRKRGVRLMDMPGFFLNDVSRIATLHYEPTDDDIVRARLRTLGVEEHRFTMESGAYPGSEWYIYDVGGSRSMRPHWIPFFDDVQAIIFLAPLAFNLMLEEDPKVNRLEDSISLWRDVCGNQLLAKTTLILFLNKMDILQATLASGIRVQKYVPSYGDQPNDVTHVVKYFRDKFRGYHKRLSPKSRPFYVHETSVIDTHATSIILVGVREGILRAHLQSVNVI